MHGPTAWRWTSEAWIGRGSRRPAASGADAPGEHRGRRNHRPGTPDRVVSKRPSELAARDGEEAAHTRHDRIHPRPEGLAEGAARTAPILARHRSLQAGQRLGARRAQLSPVTDGPPAPPHSLVQPALSRLAGVPRCCSRKFPTLSNPLGRAERAAVEPVMLGGEGVSGAIGAGSVVFGGAVRIRGAESRCAGLRAGGASCQSSVFAACRPVRSVSSRCWWRRMR
jgi:hypothetical protein